jgi:O-antigen/teichoic acid export membrane protein
MSDDPQIRSRPVSAPGASGRIARNTLLRAAGEVVAKAASLLLFVVMARELGREGFGAFMFALGLTGALLLLSGFGSEELTAREVARDHRRAGPFLANIAAIKVVSALALLGVAAGLVQLGDYSRDTRLAVYLVGLGVALEVMAKTWHAVFQAYERLWLISLSVIVQRTLTAIAGIAVLAAGGGVVAVSVVFAAGALAGLVVAQLSLRLLGVRPTALEPRRWAGLVRAGIPIGLAGLLFVLLLRLDVTLLSFLAGEATVGLYAAAFRLVEGTQFLAWSLSGAMLPWLARAEAVEGPNGLARGLELGLKAMTGMLVPIGIAFVVFADPIVDLLYGPAYADSVLPLRLLGAMSALYGVQTLIATSFIARDAPLSFARLVGVAVVVNLVANIALIPSYGADGAAAAALVSSGLLAVLSIILARRRLGRVRLTRFIGGPITAGAAMALAALTLPGPVLLRAVLASFVYFVAFAVLELAAFRDDAEAVLGALPVAVRARLPRFARSAG